jgi:hypothetical protein
MRRRTVLASVGTTLLAGCASLSGDSAPSTGGTPTDLDPNSGTSADEFAVTGLTVSTAKVHPSERYYLRVTDSVPPDAVEDDDTLTVRDVSEIDDPDRRGVIEDVLSERELWRDDIPAGLTDLTDRVDFFTWDATTDPDDADTHWSVAVFRTDPAPPALARRRRPHRES